MKRKDLIEVIGNAVLLVAGGALLFVLAIAYGIEAGRFYG